MTDRYISISAMLDLATPEAKKSLQHLIACIKEYLPEVQEGISYGMPAFKYKTKPVAGFAIFKEHCSFFPMSGNIIEKFKDELKTYETSKGTIRFKAGELLPKELIQKIISARVAEIEGNKSY